MKNWLEVTYDTQSAQILQDKDERNIYVVNKTDNVPSRLLPIRQWRHGNNSYTLMYGYTLMVPVNK